jgi:hypothetical protein
MPELSESSKLNQPHKIEGTMEEAKASLYELAKSRVKIMNDQEYSEWVKEFGSWESKHFGYSPAVAIVWPKKGEKIGDKIEKTITHLEIAVNKDKFLIDGDDYSDIIPFVIEHELSEAWLVAKKGLGDGSEEKENGFKKYVAKHRLSVRKEFLLAEQLGLGEKLFEWHMKVYPEGKEECQEAWKNAKQKLKK